MNIWEPHLRFIFTFLGGLLLLGLFSCVRITPPQLLSNIISAIMGTPLPSARPLTGELPPSLLNISIEEVADGLQSGWLTTVDLTKAYLARIDEASDFNAVLQINPDALSAAQKLDDERKNGTSRG